MADAISNTATKSATTTTVVKTNSPPKNPKAAAMLELAKARVARQNEWQNFESEFIGTRSTWEELSQGYKDTLFENLETTQKHGVFSQEALSQNLNIFDQAKRVGRHLTPTSPSMRFIHEELYPAYFNRLDELDKAIDQGADPAEVKKYFHKLEAELDKTLGESYSKTGDELIGLRDRIGGLLIMTPVAIVAPQLFAKAAADRFALSTVASTAGQAGLLTFGTGQIVRTVSDDDLAISNAITEGFKSGNWHKLEEALKQAGLESGQGAAQPVFGVLGTKVFNASLVFALGLKGLNGTPLLSAGAAQIFASTASSTFIGGGTSSLAAYYKYSQIYFDPNLTEDQKVEKFNAVREELFTNILFSAFLGGVLGSGSALLSSQLQALGKQLGEAARRKAPKQELLEIYEKSGISKFLTSEQKKQFLALLEHYEKAWIQNSKGEAYKAFKLLLDTNSSASAASGLVKVPNAPSLSLQAVPQSASLVATTTPVLPMAEKPLVSPWLTPQPPAGSNNVMPLPSNVTLRKDLASKLGGKIIISGNVRPEEEAKILNALKANIEKLRESGITKIVIAHGEGQIKDETWRMSDIEQNGIKVTGDLSQVGETHSRNNAGKVLIIACSNNNPTIADGTEGVIFENGNRGGTFALKDGVKAENGVAMARSSGKAKPTLFSNLLENITEKGLEVGDATVFKIGENKYSVEIKSPPNENGISIHKAAEIFDLTGQTKLPKTIQVGEFEYEIIFTSGKKGQIIVKRSPSSATASSSHIQAAVTGTPIVAPQVVIATPQILSRQEIRNIENNELIRIYGLSNQQIAAIGKLDHDDRVESYTLFKNGVMTVTIRHDGVSWLTPDGTVVAEFSSINLQAPVNPIGTVVNPRQIPPPNASFTKQLTPNEESLLNSKGIQTSDVKEVTSHNNLITKTDQELVSLGLNSAQIKFFKTKIQVSNVINPNRTWVLTNDGKAYFIASNNLWEVKPDGKITQINNMISQPQAPSASSPQLPLTQNKTTQTNRLFIIGLGLTGAGIIGAGVLYLYKLSKTNPKVADELSKLSDKELSQLMSELEEGIKIGDKQLTSKLVDQEGNIFEDSGDTNIKISGLPIKIKNGEVIMPSGIQEDEKNLLLIINNLENGLKVGDKQLTSKLVDQEGNIFENSGSDLINIGSKKIELTVQDGNIKNLTVKSK